MRAVRDQFQTLLWGYLSRYHINSRDATHKVATVLTLNSMAKRQVQDGC